MDIPHELRDEFPQEISLIERMIRTNYEFRRLAERYDEVNRNIYRIESGEEPTTDEVLARLKSFPIFGPSNKPDSLQLISPRSSLTLINFAQESFRRLDRIWRALKSEDLFGGLEPPAHELVLVQHDAKEW